MKVKFRITIRRKPIVGTNTDMVELTVESEDGFTNTYTGNFSRDLKDEEIFERLLDDIVKDYEAYRPYERSWEEEVEV